MKRRTIIRAAADTLVATLLSARGQRLDKVWRVGILDPGLPHRFAAFRESMRGLGYVERGNIRFEEKNAKGSAKLIPARARELVALKPDVIVTATALPGRALLCETTTIPVGLASIVIRAVLPGAAVMLLSMSAAAQAPIAFDQPASVIGPPMEPTMMRGVPYPDEVYTLPDVAPAVPYPSCYRVGRCSAYDLYRFRDRPNRLTRLAPEGPPESVAAPVSIQYQWLLVPVTPEENILPKYRTASQVRDEYRAVGRPIDGPN